jgi:hypothetical protein
LFNLEQGLVVFKIKHQGQGNFVVRLLDADGNPIALVANEIGSCSSSKAVRIPRTGSYLFDVQGRGDWSISRSVTHLNPHAAEPEPPRPQTASSPQQRTAATDIPASPSEQPPLSITFKYLEDNHSLLQLLGRDTFIPTTTIAIKLTLNSPPEAAAVRLRIEGVDRDGFQVKKFLLHDFYTVPGASASSTRIAQVHTEALRRIAAWRLVDATTVEAPWAMTLEEIQTKVVQGERKHEIYVRAKLLNRSENGLPTFVTLQGLDEQGFAACELLVTDSSATKWEPSGNQLQIEDRQSVPSGLERVRTWQALPNPHALSGLSILLDSDYPVDKD